MPDMQAGAVLTSAPLAPAETTACSLAAMPTARVAAFVNPAETTARQIICPHASAWLSCRSAARNIVERDRRGCC